MSTGYHYRATIALAVVLARRWQLRVILVSRGLLVAPRVEVKLVGHRLALIIDVVRHFLFFPVIFIVVIVVAKDLVFGRSHFLPTSCPAVLNRFRLHSSKLASSTRCHSLRATRHRCHSSSSWRSWLQGLLLSRGGSRASTVWRLWCRASKIETSQLLGCSSILLLLRHFLSILTTSFRAIEGELILCLFLGVNMRKADVIDSELKVFPVLHDCHLMCISVERVIEGTL